METPFSISASQGAIRSLPMKLELVLSRHKNELRAKEKKKLRRLKTDLEGLIDNYLIEPSEVVSPASTAHSWMKGVRDLSYDIDDFIYELDHFVAGGARISVVQKPRRFKIKICRLPEKLRRRQWITDEMSAFRTRIKEAIRRYTEYLGNNCKWRPSSSAEPTPSPSGEAANQLVGVESSIQQLCSLLANDGLPEHRVVSIVGTGGVGKTTLAREVYRKLGGQFQCLAFVRTPPKQDMKGLLTSILAQVQRGRHITDNALDVHKLVLNIKAHLQDKTYLIVIEDLWALSTWNLVNRALPKGICCSRILTTTEVDVIARACCADNSKCNPAKKENNSMYIIKKELLREDESRELFSNRAFGKQAECPQGVKEVSNEIIKRSGGLPLGINILAGLLAHHPASSIEQWNYIQNSLSSDLTTHANSEKMNQVLNIGYDNLPHYLKACILYLCMYEEDCIIWKDDLVKQWIAEGFISALNGEDKEEVGRSYFGELVNRGMIQPVDTNCSDEILSCRVHHMVLHFIRDKCMDENFCIAVDRSQTSTRLDKVRRLALHLGNVEHAKPPGDESMRLSRVRSIAFSGFLKCMPSIVEFRFLQVLNLKLSVDPDNMMSHNLTGFDDLSGNLIVSDDLSGNLTGSDDLSGNIAEPNEWTDNLSEPDGLSYNLTGISELFRLRYFRLDACHLSVELPAQMQQLKVLMAWEIDAEVTSVPSDIVDLTGLLYLRIPSEAHLPTGIGRMTSLRTLGVVDLSKNSTEDVMTLGELTNLQDLHLTCSTLHPDNLEKNLECLGSVIRKLCNVKCVTLVPSAYTHVNTQHDAGASSMSTSWNGLNIVPLLPALLQRLELSWRCCHFSRLPEWTKDLTKLCILKIAVRKVSQEDVLILKGLPSLTALSLFIWTAPVIRIIFDNEGFSVLKYFKFVCAAPRLEFLDGAMPNVRKLKLGFNSNELDVVGLERLTGLNEISTKIGHTGADEGNRKSAPSVLTDAIGMHPSTPIIVVQWVDWNFCGDDEKHVEPRKETRDQIQEKQNVTAAESSILFSKTEAKTVPSASIDVHNQTKSSGEHGIQEKILEEDGNKQADTRTRAAPESTFHLQNTDLKLSLIEKYADGVAEKHKIDSGGYGEIDKGEDAYRGQQQPWGYQQQPAGMDTSANQASFSAPAVQATSSDDGYNWRKYGQKQVKGSENPRSYYKCTFPNCPTKKKVETSIEGQITEIVYKGTHNHAKPVNTRRGSGGGAGVQVLQSGGDASEHSFGAMSGAPVSTPGNSSASFGDDEIGASSHRAGNVGGDDLDDDEPDSKKWRKDGDGDGINDMAGNQTVREARAVVQTMSDIDILDDGYRWRKYGQKVVKGNPNPRSYYKCTTVGCPVRKHVERASHDLRAVITTYEGKHNHDVPAARGSAALYCPVPRAADSAMSTSIQYMANQQPSAITYQTGGAARTQYAPRPDGFGSQNQASFSFNGSFGFSGFDNPTESYMSQHQQQQRQNDAMHAASAKEEPKAGVYPGEG